MAAGVGRRTCGLAGREFRLCMQKPRGKTANRFQRPMAADFPFRQIPQQSLQHPFVSSVLCCLLVRVGGGLHPEQTHHSIVWIACNKTPTDLAASGVHNFTLAQRTLNLFPLGSNSGHQVITVSC